MRFIIVISNDWGLHISSLCRQGIKFLITVVALKLVLIASLGITVVILFILAIIITVMMTLKDFRVALCTNIAAVILIIEILSCLGSRSRRRIKIPLARYGLVLIIAT